MPRMTTRTGEIGDLILLDTSLLQHGAKQMEHLDAQLLVHLTHLTLLQHPVDLRSLLVSQVVGGDVRDIQFDGLAQVILPSGEGLVRQSVDKIDTDVRETVRLATTHRRLRLLRRMPAVQEGQVIVVETLYANAQTVNGEAFQRRQESIGEVVRVRLQRHLLEGARVIRLNGREDFGELVRAQERRRTAPEVERLDGRLPQVVPPLGQLRADSLDQFGTVAVERGGVEVAIDATAPAERNMDVDACHGAKIVKIGSREINVFL